MIREALLQFGANSRREWSHDRTKTVGASEIGLCSRRIWFSKHNTPVDEDYLDGWGFMLRGTVAEAAYFVPAMQAKYGKRFRYGGESQKTFTLGPDRDNPVLSATPDGLLRDVTPEECAVWGIPETNCILIEFKNIGSYKLALAPKPEHEFQVQVQMACVRAAGRYFPGAAILVYTSAFNWAETVEFAIPWDAQVAMRAVERATEILSAWYAVDVKAEGRLAGGNECRRCPYATTCGDIELSRSLRASAEAA